MSNNENNKSSQIPLIPSKILQNSGIIEKFVIDPNDKYVKLRLNSKYNPIIPLDVSTEIIKEKDGWTKFTNKFRIGLKPYKIDKDHENWIISTITENGDLIRRVARSVNNNNSTATTSSSQQQEQQQKQEESTIEISYTEWFIKLVEKYSDLQKEILNLIPELWEPVEFALSVRTILRIKNITLPFAGIILGSPSSLKTATIELFRNTRDNYYTDNFSAKSFVSHNTISSKGKTSRD